MFSGDERGELGTEALHVLPPLPLDLLPLHRRRRRRGAAVVARAASLTCRCSIAAPALLCAHLHRCGRSSLQKPLSTIRVYVRLDLCQSTTEIVRTNKERRTLVATRSVRNFLTPAILNEGII